MLEFVIEKLIGLLGPIATLEKNKRELKDDALRAISTALNETAIYYRDLARSKERNFEVEAQLVRYWSAAAIPLRHIDQELASICENKAEYWLNPEEWSNEQVIQFGIKLEDVKKAYRQMAIPAFNKEDRFGRT
ncbi:hypothetical protein [Celerinatantimonas sp. MCCC 1A17872]|uniref:hypothetical protein n=1 Tax=Celerinatantimonas sp. MCCC 1A17872 TaxID=3177514 RepID=UPI0038BE5190